MEEEIPQALHNNSVYNEMPNEAETLVNIMESVNLAQFKPKDIPEHPRGDEIREQVEYYFSDENLVADSHLLTLCGGNQNLPVSVGEILGWKKMRKYRPKTQVIEALKKSKHLEIVNGKRIRRKVPFNLANVNSIDPHDTSDDPVRLAKIPIFSEGTTKEAGNDDKTAPLKPGYEYRKGVIVKIRDNKKPQSTADETAIEGPLTPQQYAEESELYGSGIMLRERLEAGIYRFYTRPKMSHESKRLFDVFMRFGGVDVRPIMFGGANKRDRRDIKELDPLLQARMMGIHELPETWDATESDKFKVDFMAIARTFLGNSIARDLSPEDMQKICQVMINFYNYLLMHNICEDFKEQILATRKLVENTAVPELRMISNATRSLPGQFSHDCALLFGGHDSVIYRAIKKKPATDADPDEFEDYEKTMRAILNVTKGIAAYGTGAMAKFITENDKWHDSITCEKAIEGSFEIQAIHYPTPEARKVYETIDESSKAESILFPLGKLVCRPWSHDLDIQYDLPAGYTLEKQVPDEVSFLVEESILVCLKERMKFEGTIRQLDFAGNGQIWVIDRLHRIYCSFYEPLLNELMPKGKLKSIKWKIAVPALGKEIGDFENE